MAWPAVEELVRGWVQRSYLKDYRWWLELILDEFAFLEGWGYTLPADDLKGVKFHQEGNYVWFSGPGRDIVIEYDPESSFIKADFVDDAASRAPRYTSLDEALRATGSVEEPPPRLPLDRAATEATIRWWAEGLRANAATLLGVDVT